MCKKIVMPPEKHKHYSDLQNWLDIKYLLSEAPMGN
jgi:hypothetical protein